MASHLPDVKLIARDHGHVKPGEVPELRCGYAPLANLDDIHTTEYDFVHIRKRLQP